MVLAESSTLAGQLEEKPLQLSGTSQGPAGGRQVWLEG